MITKVIEKPNIIIVDDHLIFRQGLISLLTSEEIATVIAEASDGAAFLELLSHHKPDLVLMDIDMPHMNGMEATQKALEKLPKLKIVVFSMFGDEEYFRKMVQLGVKGYILKSNGISEVEQAIQDVMNGKTYFSNILPKNTENKLNQNQIKEVTEKPKGLIPWF